MSQSRPIDFVENFVFSPDRGASLKTLIPGTEDYYYYHCLHYQNTEQFDQVEPLVEKWIERLGRSERVRQIQNRQALLTYRTNPDKSLAYLKQELNLRFDHQREIPEAEKELPSRLDASLLDLEKLMAESRAAHVNTAGFTDAGLHLLFDQQLNEQELVHLLERTSLPDAKNLVERVVQQLSMRRARPFGSLPIHQQLTQRQLEQLLEKMPRLLNEGQFVNAYLAKLKPTEDELPAFAQVNYDEPELNEYLRRLEAFVEPLGSTHNSLKALVQYHRLQFELHKGRMNRELFEKYIQLPRPAWYVEPRWIRRAQAEGKVADLNANYSPQVLLPPVGNDEPLVRAYLQHFFQTDDSWESLQAWLKDDYLQQVFAETKILNGLGDVERWASLLTPEQYQQISDRVELNFLPTNRRRFRTEDAVELELDVKNVPSLLVKVFKINTYNYYTTFQREISTDIQLDGLVPNWEQTFEIDTPPAQRKRMKFPLESIQGPGVYVVDFIGNGVSSRALIRKGMLSFATEMTAAGPVFDVYDWENERVKNAQVWVDGNAYTADENGRIYLPFSNAPGRRAVVISLPSDQQSADSAADSAASSAPGFSSLGFFNHQAESYSLECGFYVDRESLLQGEKATVVLRPAVLVGALLTDLKILEDVSLTINTTDADGTVASKTISDLQLNLDRETPVEFVVPERLRQVAFELQAKVRVISRAEDTNLTASQSFQLNSIDASGVIRDIHLLNTAAGYKLEVLDKTGIGLPRQSVLVTLNHRFFTSPIQVSLQTDAKGQIELGPLAEISGVSASLSDVKRNWSLNVGKLNSFSVAQSPANQTIEVPCRPDTRLDRRDLALFEIRGDSFVRDCFDSVAVDAGLVTISDLEPGDYQLVFKKENRSMRLRVNDAEELGADNVAFGGRRNLQIRNTDPVVIRQVEASDEGLAIQLGNASEDARVHVFATRYQPAYNAFDGLHLNLGLNPFATNRPDLAGEFVVGRNIGDEYRYILERKLADKFPGNMLQRPSLLIRPWSIQSTDNFQQVAQQGGDFDGKSAPPAEAPRAQRPGGSRVAGFADESQLDFLQLGSSLMLNLKPDAEGQVVISREALQGHFNLQVMVVDQQWSVQRQCVLEETPLRRLDRRLVNSLDTEKHFALRKNHQLLAAGEQLEVANHPTTRIETFDELSDVYRLLATLSNDSTFAEFRFVLDWPNKSQEEKQELYSKYACHELNFFVFKKDPQFFADVVKPFIANKRDKTFVDRWLLELAEVADSHPANYRRLNAAERVMLGAALPDQRELISRNIQDLVELKPVAVGEHDRFYRAIFKNSALEQQLGLIAGMEFEKSSGGLGGDFDAAGGQTLSAAPGAGGGGFGGGYGGGGFGGRGLMPSDDPANAPSSKTRQLGRSENSEIQRGGDVAGKLDDAVESEAMDMGESGQADKDARGRYRLRRKNVYFEEDLKRRGDARLQNLYRRLQPTLVWAETNYYRLPIANHTYDRIPANKFWLDYARHEAQSGFLSPHFTQCTSSFSEMMFALAVLDLPFEAKEHKQEKDEGRIVFDAASPLIAFHQQVQPVAFERRGSTILVSENFFRADDRYQNIDGRRFDKFVTEEFLAQVLYGGQVVVTNPTSTPSTVDVLIQIPQGSLPATNTQISDSTRLELDAFSTQTFEYFFYFPEAGDFQHYPAHVSDEQKVLAVAESQDFDVLAEPQRVDQSSWSFVSQNGSEDDVIEFLNANNVLEFNLNRIAFRMSDSDFFARSTRTLSNRFAYDATLWSYGIQHNDVERIEQFLQNHPFAEQCGPYLDSPLLHVDPVARRTYEHLEFSPLVNSRQHPLGKQRTINNPKLWEQYHQFLAALACKNQVTHDERLALVYYLLLQDRIGEAIEQFGKVTRDSVATQVQYDYCQAYISLYTEQLEVAQRMADKYLQYPVDHWRTRFANIHSQLAEIRGETAEVADGDDRDQAQDQLAAKEPAFELQTEGRTVTLGYQNLAEATVNFYRMDIELLFSRNPFVKSQTGGFNLIQPNATRQISLDGKGSTTIELPAELASENLLVEVVAAGRKQSTTLLSNTLDVKLSENFGQLKVSSKDTGQAISRVYVKVYARSADGRIEFYKDGYTDLRGRFDYVSNSNVPLDSVEQFALLILSETEGAIVRQAGLPTE